MGETATAEDRLPEEWKQLLNRFKQVLKESEDRHEASSALRRDFFDKLMLLDGGTIALSVTLLGNLSSHHASTRSIRFLAASWMLLILGMALAMASKWFFHEHQRASAGIWLANRLIEDNEQLIEIGEKTGGPMDVFKAALRKQKGIKTKVATRRKRARSVILWCERLSLCSTIAGYSCLVWFAIYNLSVFTTGK